MKSVLFVAAEAVPFIKTGGLGDVVGSLPKELNNLGCEVRIILPKYEDIPVQWEKKMNFRQKITVPLGWRQQYCGIFEGEHDGLTYYFIDNEYYFKRRGLYGFADDAERFAFFCRAVLEVLPHLEFEPEVLHCHDWHTAVLPVLLQAHYRNKPGYTGLRTVLTIHNIEYQGIFPPVVLEDLLELDNYTYFTADKLEFHGKVNYLKGGIAFADAITTVSESYAREIMTPQGGKQLDGILRRRQQDLSGIVNGIDYEIYNPEYDSYLFRNYHRRSTGGKLMNKLKLQEALCLPVNPEIPLIGMVSRLVAAKGFDLIAAVLDELLAMNVQVVVLGTGEEKYESMFRVAAHRYPEKLSANLYFDDCLAHRIYAASDIYLMPSLSEPCGISQLIALAYGAVPVVRETGGLKDTIDAYNEYTFEGNGFSFTYYDNMDMLDAVNRALSFFHDKAVWFRIMDTAMSCDYSWQRSAAEYAALYDRYSEGGNYAGR